MFTFSEWHKRNEDLSKIKCFIVKTPVSYNEVKKEFNVTKEEYNRIIKEMGYEVSPY